MAYRQYINLFLHLASSMLLYLRKTETTMRYLVDGHNLIPHIPGLRLEALDDEMDLIRQLQAFCALGGHQVEVYFDNAPPGGVGMRRFGKVTAHFVRAGSTADAAIARRLISLGRGARQWCVVSADRSVQAAARASQAEVLTSPEFTLRMKTSPRVPVAEKRETPLNSDEVDEWLQIFQPKRASGSPSPGKKQEH